MAVVDRLWLLEPASGSVMAKTTFSPCTRPGSHAPRCSSVPKRAMSSALIAADTMISSSGDTSGGELLAHDGQLGHAPAAAAPFLGEVHGEEAVVGDRLPELVGGAVLARAGCVVVVAEPARHAGDGIAEQLVLG